MRWQIISALLAALCCHGQGWLQGQTQGPRISTARVVFGFSIADDRDTHIIKPQGHADVQVLLERAEAALHEAAALQQKQTSKDLSAAVRLLGKSAQLFVSIEAREKAADAHFRAGEIYFTLSEYDRSRRSFRQVLSLTRDAELECKALSRIARTYATTGPFPLADQYSNRAMELCGKLSQNAQAEALEARGETLNFAGERSNSEEYFLRARDLFAAAQNDDGEAQALLMLAYNSFFSGTKRVQGLEAAAQALRLWSSTGNRYGVARMHSMLGIYAVARGEFETAQCNYKAAKPVFRQIGNKDDEGAVFNGLGFVSRETGDWQNSLQYYREGRATFKSVRDSLGELEAIQGMGKALYAGKNYKHLLQLYKEELLVAQRVGDPVAVAYALEDIGSAYEAQSRYTEAETYYRRALEGYRAANHLHSQGDALIRLGHLQASRKQYSQAIASLERANALKEKTGQVEEVAKIHYELARIYRQLNRLEDALAAIKKTIETIEKQRVSISQFESRASYFASVHQYYSLYVQILMLLHQRQPAQGFAEMAFAASEKSKVRSLLDLLTTSAQDAPCEELLARQLSVAGDAERNRADATSPPSAASTLTMKEVQAELERDDTVLLEYALGDEKSYLWLIDEKQVSSHELPPSQQIKKLVELFRGTLLPPQPKEGETAFEYQSRARKADEAFQSYARQLSRLLLGPVHLAGKRRILIVPDGSLQYIPFAALPLPGRTNREPLVSTEEVVMLPSASVLASLRKAAAKRTPPTATAAIFADPVFELDDPRVSALGIHGKTRAPEPPLALKGAMRDAGASAYIPRLPASRNEANTIATILRAEDPEGVHVALDFDASRALVLTEGLARFRLVHFATHGVVDSRNPERSGLILSLVDRRGKRGDGYLRLGDIYKLKLSADLVVLSSCDSALGRDLQSEGIIGLPRGFLYAGAKSVIATLWKVNDEATARLMTTLYARIRRGESPSSALRGAQLEMVRDREWSNPYYWAAFSLQGDYR